MSNLFFKICIPLILVLGLACEKLLTDPDPVNSPFNNFEVLWKNLDRKYAFFGYKKIDWDSIYTVYSQQITDDMPDTLLFNTLGGMMMELEDAHADLHSWFGTIHYDHAAAYPANFSNIILQTSYLFITAKTLEGIQYRLFDSVGYLRIESFSKDISNEGFRQIISDLGDVKGYILDVRDNKGGKDSNPRIILNHFLDVKRLLEIKYHKTGPGHNEFTAVKEYISPDNNSLGINKTTIVLTNRRTFSAANGFVSWMSSLPHVILAGDTTGGGGGTPHFSELPNGWTYRYSANQSLRPDGLNTDLGIPPDEVVYQTNIDTRKQEDTLIKYALSIFRDK